MKKIKQIEKSQVMSVLLNDKPVYRLNIENNSLADLRTKTIQVIKRDMEKDCYLYFTIEDEEEKLCRNCEYYNSEKVSCSKISLCLNHSRWKPKSLRAKNIFHCDICGTVFESPDKHITCPYCGRELYKK